MESRMFLVVLIMRSQTPNVEGGGEEPNCSLVKQKLLHIRIFNVDGINLKIFSAANKIRSTIGSEFTHTTSDSYESSQCIYE